MLTQLQKQMYGLCSKSSSVSVFLRQCSKSISQSGIFLLLEDDALQSVCDGAEQNATNCYDFTIALVDLYYQKALRDLLVNYGYLMTNDYIEKEIIPLYDKQVSLDLSPTTLLNTDYGSKLGLASSEVELNSFFSDLEVRKGDTDLQSGLESKS